MAASAQAATARYLWAVLIACIYEVFPLLCPNCGGQMRLIAFITEGTQIRKSVTNPSLRHNLSHGWRHFNPLKGVPMPRRRPETFAWSLDSSDPTSLPNARIALALIHCVRRLPGAFPAHSFDDLGATLAPVVALHARLARRLIIAHQHARLVVDPSNLLQQEASVPDFLQDADTHILLGEAFARATPRFRPLFDKVEASLSKHIASHAFDSDRNLEMLTRLLGLEAPEAAILQLAATFCYGSLERTLFNFVESPARILHVIESICGARGSEGVKMFQGQGRLSRSGLLNVLNNGISSRVDLEDLLRLSPLGDALLGVPHADEQAMARVVLSPMTASHTSTPLDWPHLRLEQTLMRSALMSALEGSVPGVNFLLYGGPGTGKTEFARQLVAEMDALAFSVAEADDNGQEASRGERLASLQLSQTFAGQAGRAVLVLDEAEDIFQDDYHQPLGRQSGRRNESKAWMNALLEKNPHPVVWISNRVSQLDPAYLRRFTYCVEFPATPSTVRRRIARQRLGTIGCSDGLIDALVAMPEVTPAQMDAAARFATLTRKVGANPDTAVESLIRSHLKAAGHPEPALRPAPATRFDMRYLNVAGNATPERILTALQAGLLRASAATLLFSGPPGTGKTQLAAEIASRLGRRLVVRTASDINSKWYGESEGKVAQMFRDCDAQDELLFLDEADVVLGAREGTQHRADRAVTAEFLRWLEVFKGIFVCATNHPGMFDAALMRRFTFRVEFQALSARQRRELYAELALGWRADLSSPFPVLPPSAEARLTSMDGLTPGDFANASRRIQALDLPPGAWMDELEAEHQAKPSALKARIGFL